MKKFIILGNCKLIIVEPLFPVVQLHTTIVCNYNLEAEEWHTWLNIRLGKC